MYKNLLIASTAWALGVVAVASSAQTQGEAEQAQAQQREAEAQAQQEQARSIAEARTQMEQARRQLEDAARRVAELTGGPFRAFMALPVPPAPPGGARATLGIVIEDADDGVLVTGVTPNGPAASGGVAVGDIITAVDAVTLAGSDSESQRLIDHMATVEPGQDVVLHIQRDGAARDVSVETDENEGFVVFSAEPEQRLIVRGRDGPGAATWVGPGPVTLDRFFGGRWNDLELVALTHELGSYFGTSEGLLVVRAPDDDSIGLKDGDVILAIGGREPTSPEHAMRILMSFEAGETLELSIMRRQRRETIAYTIPGDGTRG